MAVIQQIIRTPQTRLTQLHNSLRNVLHAIQQLPGPRQPLTMIHSTSRSIAESIRVNGRNAPNVILRQQILRYSVVLFATNTAVKLLLMAITGA